MFCRVSKSTAALVVDVSRTAWMKPPPAPAVTVTWNRLPPRFDTVVLTRGRGLQTVGSGGDVGVGVAIGVGVGVAGSIGSEPGSRNTIPDLGGRSKVATGIPSSVLNVPSVRLTVK